MAKQNTLCILLKGDQVLLAMKKRGFGEGKWNGVGGKVQEGETPEAAAIRETEEEIEVTPKNLEHVATVYYDPFNIEMFVYLVNVWEGEPTETEEMAPKWFKRDGIPYKEMWESDARWLPLVLEGRKITAKFVYDDNNHLLEESTEEWK